MSDITPAIATPAPGDILSGDLLVESIGNEVRIWQAITVDGKLRVRLQAKSWVFMRERVLQTVSDNKVQAAPDMTVTKLYCRKDRQKGFQILRKYFPDASVAHFFYSGCGPSGQRWNFSKDYYTCTLARVEVSGS